MDITWVFVLILLVVIFAAISVIGALRRIAAATEASAAHLETLARAAEVRAGT
jgi:hypothetical protein